MFKIIANILPLALLPAPHRTKYNVTIDVQSKIFFTERERREHFEQIIRSTTLSFLTKYSGFNFSRDRFRNYKSKKELKLFYALMGELAVTHACIEQDLKNTIRLDLGNLFRHIRNSPLPVINEKRCGIQLTKEFLDIIKKHVLIYQSNYELYLKYESWINKFNDVSNLRNDTLKGLYQVTPLKNTIHKIYIPSSLEMMRQNNQDDIIELLHNAIKKIDLHHIKEQIKVLKNIRAELNAIRCETIQTLTKSMALNHHA